MLKTAAMFGILAVALATGGCDNKATAEKAATEKLSLIHI